MLWRILQKEVVPRGASPPPPPQPPGFLSWAWGGRTALDFYSSELTLWQLEWNQRLGEGQS